MSYRLSAILICLGFLSLPGQGNAAQRQKPTVTIGIITDGSYDRHEDLLLLFRQEIIDLLSIDYNVRLPDDKHLRGDWTLSRIDSAVDQLLADPEVDLVLTLGPISSHLASGRRNLPKPLVTPIIIDAQLQGLPMEDGASGIPNLSYVALPLGRDLEVFREIVEFDRVAILINGPLAEAIPGIAEKTRTGSLALGIEPTIIRVGMTVDSALEALAAGQFEAVYVLPQLQLSPADWDLLVQTLIDRRLPSFTWIGRREVVDGILAGRRPERFMQRLARRNALNVQRILLGEEPGRLPVGFAAQERLTINMATARAIGAYPPFKIMTEAELIADEDRIAEREVSLESAVRDALSLNLDLAAADRAVAAGAQDVKLARSDLLPQIDLSALANQIDEDRAGLLFAGQPERLFAGSATLRQVIYAEPLWANLSVQGSVQEAREQDRESLRLDIAQQAAVTYLNVLIAKTVERIERENLFVTRENLELSQIREQIGTASAGEVYRWETVIASNRGAVIDANARRNVTEIELNRLLNRPLEERFATAEADLSDPVLLSSQDRLYSYLSNQQSFRVFRQFMAQEAIESSPELRAIAAIISAQQRALKSAGRSFWLPTLGLEASVTNTFSTSGAGSQFFPGSLGLNGADGFQPPDDIGWSVAFVLSYPLLTGGGRFAVRSQAAEELAQLEVEREALSDRVEGRVRSTLHEMGASLANIDLSRDAAEAARSAFGLVQDSYSRGAASVTDLLDAQQTALTTDAQASNAVYDFLIDMMNVERAAGRFDFFTSADQREAFFQRLEQFFQERGVTPAGR